MVRLPAEGRIADTILEADPGHAERHCRHALGRRLVGSRAAAGGQTSP
jgi:hypothetical protein